MELSVVDAKSRRATATKHSSACNVEGDFVDTAGPRRRVAPMVQKMYVESVKLRICSWCKDMDKRGSQAQMVMGRACGEQASHFLALACVTFGGTHSGIEQL